MASKGLRAISYQGPRKVAAGYKPLQTTETLIGYIVCWQLGFIIQNLQVIHLVQLNNFYRRLYQMSYNEHTHFSSYSHTQTH